MKFAVPTSWDNSLIEQLKELKNVIEKRVKDKELDEVIIALSFNPESEHTASYITQELEPLKKKYKFKISTLGRGLSTGTELEYSDNETLASALLNRR